MGETDALRRAAIICVNCRCGIVEASVPPANGGNTGPADEQISPTVSLREWDFFDYMSGNVIK